MILSARSSRHLVGTVLALALGALTFHALTLTPSYRTVQEAAFDLVLGVRPAPTPRPPVMVIDIDRATLAAVGPWPWSRERLAALVTASAGAGPKAVGLDILIDGDDQRSPAALARRLGDATGRRDLAELATALPDGDQALAVAVRAAGAVLGLALDPDGPGNSPAGSPVLVSGGTAALFGLWLARGAIGPAAAVGEGASGFGVLSLPGDADGRIRRVPLLVVAGQTLRPGLALELVRSATDVGAIVVAGDSGVMLIGELALVLPADGLLRLRPVASAQHAARTVSAADLLAPGPMATAVRDRLTGAVVLIGSSAPEVAGLRPSATGELVSTVQLHADAVSQLLAGDQPHRPDWLPWLERAGLLVLAALAGWVAFRQPPTTAALVAAGLALIWAAFAVTALDTAQWLVDPVTPPLAGLAAFALCAFIAASRTRVREAAIRRRFEQQLPAIVVQRLLASPELLKLAGEARRITALFTDIEGFTSMTERAGPQALVQMLDRYFDGLVRLVVEHGGMVEKIVGDGLHAIFNAPLDLDDHAGRAVACAIAIQDFTERLRTEGEPARLGFGPTRIGIETGDVVLGDVGGGRYLDYTAHGDVMNTASRLEAANKDLASRICIGPVAAAAIATDRLRPLGRIAVRGRRQPMAVFEPWPPAMAAADRALFSTAAEHMATDPVAAVAVFAALAERYPADASLGRLTAEITRRSASPP
jgi:adenylate cyclase